jgi:predicted transcriptional regulator
MKSKFESSMLIIRALRNSNGLKFSKIYRKANIPSTMLKSYLDFLMKEDFIGSRPPEKDEVSNGPTGQIYFVKESGYRFEAEWEKYKIRHSVDDIKNLLQSIV